jgi:hypothetical protein
MLQFHSKQRPKFGEVIALIEDDNNLHEETETSEGRQGSIGGSAMSRNRIEKGHN